MYKAFNTQVLRGKLKENQFLDLIEVFYHRVATKKKQEVSRDFGETSYLLYGLKINFEKPH